MDMKSIEKAAARLELGSVAPDLAPATESDRHNPGRAEPRLAEPVQSEVAQETSRLSRAEAEAPSRGPRRPRTIVDLGALLGERVDAMSGMGELAEEYRVLKRPLLNSAFENGTAVHPANLIAVTSALEGEGKTFTAINLALSIAAELDHTVLLVDADLIKTSLSRQFALDDAPGLSDILAGRGGADIASAICDTSLPKLKVIPAGTLRRGGTELFASERMRQLAREISLRYRDRLVIFDAAPLLMTSQAAVLTALVDQVVLVVEEGRTPQQVVQEAVGQIASERSVWVLLNKSTAKRSRYYGGYYGNYG